MKNLRSNTLWLFARIELGISKAEFNSMTPHEWRTAMGVWMDREKRKAAREDHLIARLALFINISTVPRKKGDKLPVLSDFLPVDAKTARKDSRTLTPLEVLRKAQQLFPG